MSKEDDKNIEDAAKSPCHDGEEGRQSHGRGPSDVEKAAMATDSRAQYDECVKRLLGDKEILSHIITGCVDGLTGMNPKDVEKLIEGEPRIGIPIDPGLTNAYWLEPGKRITGMNTESSEVGEGLVKFDIVFYVRLPDGASKVIINVEAQKSVGSSPILNRAVYYACRQISSQKDREFTGMGYKDIKRVYSIWICMNQPENSITRYRLEKSDLFGSAIWKGDPALLNIVMIGITSAPRGREEGGGLNRLLSTLLSMDMPPEEKLAILRDEYDIAEDEELEEEVNDMCNLSDDIWERGIEEGIEKGMKRGIEEGIEKGMKKGREEGIEEGIEKGMKKGREEGREEGMKNGRIEIILNMHDNDFTLEQIALATKKSQEEVRAIIEERDSVLA